MNPVIGQRLFPAFSVPVGVGENVGGKVGETTQKSSEPPLYEVY